jgi:hypothetical protein
MLLESIGETIHALLGDKPQRVLFKRLDNDFHLKREGIPDRLEDFENAMVLLLGAVITRVITRAIARCLYTKLELSYSHEENWSLGMYVQDCSRQVKQHRPGSLAK